MSGAMHKMGVYLGLVEDADDYADADRYGDTDQRAPADAERRPVRAVRADSGSTVAHLSEHRPKLSSGEMSRITTLHPRTYNEARTIGEHFRDGVPVIMNLSEMDDNDAKRLVDLVRRPRRGHRPRDARRDHPAGRGAHRRFVRRG